MGADEDRHLLQLSISIIGTLAALLAAAITAEAIDKAIAAWILVAIALTSAIVAYVGLRGYPLFRNKAPLTSKLELPKGVQLKRPSSYSLLAFGPFIVAIGFWTVWVLLTARWPMLDNYIAHVLGGLAVIYIALLAYLLLRLTNKRRAAERRSGYHRRSAKDRNAKRNWRPRGVFDRD